MDVIQEKNKTRQDPMNKVTMRGKFKQSSTCKRGHSQS